MIAKLKHYFPVLILFMFFISLYVYTAAPGVYEGDSGEITAAVNKLGLAHPTGFPLYILLGKLFTILLPIRDVAYRLNIFSSLLTTIALVFLFYTLKNFGRSILASLVACFVLGFGRNTIWYNAGTTNVYAISLFFVSILLFIFSKWESKSQTKYLYWYGFLWGLSLGTHALMLIMGIPFLFMLWQSRRLFKEKITNLAKIVFLTILPGVQYIYLIFAYKRNGIVNWGSMNSFHDFIYYITQREYAGKIFNRTLTSTMSFLGKITSLLTSEFTLFFFLVAVIGLVLLYKKNKVLLAIFLAVAFANIIIMFGYGNDEIELLILYRYIFIADIALAVVMAFGVDGIIDWLNILKNKKHFIIFTLTTFLVVLFQFNTALAVNNRRNIYVIGDTAHNILNNVEPNSLILAINDSIIGPLWYLQSTGERTDVTVISSPLIPFDWYDKNLSQRYPDIFDPGVLQNNSLEDKLVILTKKNISERPVYAVFNSTTNGKLAENFDFVPHGLLVRLLPKQASNERMVVESNKAVWGKYDLKNIKVGTHHDVSVDAIEKFYGLSLYQGGITYYNNGLIDDSINMLQESLELYPDQAIVQKNLDYIRNKKVQSEH